MRLRYLCVLICALVLGSAATASGMPFWGVRQAQNRFLQTMDEDCGDPLGLIRICESKGPSNCFYTGINRRKQTQWNCSGAMTEAIIRWVLIRHCLVKAGYDPWGYQTYHQKHCTPWLLL